jgi:hypothetical protein
MSSAVRLNHDSSRFLRDCHQVISLSAFDVAPAYGNYAPSVLKASRLALLFLFHRFCSGLFALVFCDN